MGYRGGLGGRGLEKVRERREAVWRADGEAFELWWGIEEGAGLWKGMGV